MSYRYTLQQLVNDIDRKLHTGGTALTQDLFGALDEGRRNFINKVWPPELVRSAYLEEALYDQIDRYAVPSDLKYDDVVDIKLLSSRRNLDTQTNVLEQVYRKRFDEKRRMGKNVFNVSYTNGIKFMRIYHPKGMKERQQLCIADMNSLTESGTWNVGGNIVNLQLDRLKYITGKGSYRFDINDSSNAGFIECQNLQFPNNNPSTPVDIDITPFLQLGAVFTWLDLPYWKVVTSVKLSIGSDSSNYYSYSVVGPHDNNQFLNDWNLLKFPLDNLEVTGIPNPANITYLRIDISTTGQTLNACHFENVVARKGNVYQIKYNSPFVFIDANTYTWMQYANDGSNLLPFEEDSYQCFMLECAQVVMKEIYGNAFGSEADINALQADLTTAYQVYQGNHPGEVLDPYDSVYIFGNMYDGFTDDLIDGGGGLGGDTFGTWFP